VKWYNKTHTPKHYQVGNKVLLSSKNLRLSRPSKNLDFRFLGLFEITAALGKQAYRLDLLKTLGAIYSVFYISLLELYHQWASEAPLTPPLPILLNDSEEYEVEAILNTY
jgi:hypothetical protein